MKGYIHILLIATFCLQYMLGQAQMQVRELKGKVIDQQSKQPLSDVSVQIYGATQGTTSQADGSFKLLYHQKELILELSRIGYEKKLFQVVESTKEVVFSISPKIDTLENTLVRSKKRAPAPDRPSNVVIDYSLQGGQPVVISYINHIPRLSLLNADLDTMNYTGIPSKPHSLFEDCLGYMHLIYDTSTYQVFNDQGQLHLLFPANFSSFQEYLFPCVGQDQSYLYFYKKYGNRDIVNADWQPVAARDSVMDYYMVDRLTKSKKPLTTIANPRAIETNAFLVQWIKKKEREGYYIAPNDSGMGNQSNNDEMRRRRIDAGLYTMPQQVSFDYLLSQQLFIKTLYAPLFVANDTVYVFNFENAKIQCYYNGSIFDEVEFKFHNEKGAQREILHDRKTNQFYALFDINGTVSLYEIDMRKGTLKNKQQILLSYPEKITVYNNNIYYLHSLPDAYKMKTTLIHQKINTTF